MFGGHCPVWNIYWDLPQILRPQVLYLLDVEDPSVPSTPRESVKQEAARCTMSSPSSHHRHQASLEGVLDLFPAMPPLSPRERQEADRVFTAVVGACEPLQNQEPYRQVTLVRLTYEYARSEASKDNFLRFFLQQTQIPIEASERDCTSLSEYGPRLVALADTLFGNFFLPCMATLDRSRPFWTLANSLVCRSVKASTRKTPQPSPATLSDLRSPQAIAGTNQRLASLRAQCLIRDRHRCVISRTFDRDEAKRRVSRDTSDNAQDDEGNLLREESGTFAVLEVAHIIPHSLMTVSTGRAELVCRLPLISSGD